MGAYDYEGGGDDGDADDEDADCYRSRVMRLVATVLDQFTSLPPAMYHIR